MDKTELIDETLEQRAMAAASKLHEEGPGQLSGKFLYNVTLHSVTDKYDPTYHYFSVEILYKKHWWWPARRVWFTTVAYNPRNEGDMQKRIHDAKVRAFAEARSVVQKEQYEDMVFKQTRRSGKKYNQVGVFDGQD